MNVKLSKGNTKLGNIMNISLAPVKACVGLQEICGKGCYARKAYTQYKAVREAWDNNFILANDFPELYFLSMRHSLEKYKGDYFRWHVAGDILDYSYLTEMVEIAKEFPKIKFLAFTKKYAFAMAYFHHNKGYPANMSIVLSAWPGLPLNNHANLPVAYMQDGTEDRVPLGAVVCPGSCIDCKFCWGDIRQTGGVVFKKH